MRKGQTNNPNGRPVGAKNRTTYDTKLFISKFINSKQEDLEAAWDELEPFEKFQVYTKLANFVLPKMRAVEASINFARLDAESIDAIVAGLAKQQNTAPQQLSAGEADDKDDSETED